jgi:hypothetical protein
MGLVRGLTPWVSPALNQTVNTCQRSVPAQLLRHSRQLNTTWALEVMFRCYSHCDAFAE